jgi:hypothetical protein
MFTTLPIRQFIKVIKAIILIYCSLLWSSVYADSCDLIQNNSERNFCKGVSKGDSSYCSMIQNNNMQNNCTAQAKHDHSYCSMIMDSNLRNLCKARSGG